MGRSSGEQHRRVVLRGVAATDRYERLMLNRDRLRLVKALRDTANRIEAEAKREHAVIAATKTAPSPLAVTDHAVVRFMERVMDIDIPAIRQQIARAVPAVAIDPSASDGDHSIWLRDGFQFLLTPHSVISVLSPHMNGQSWLERDDLAALESA